MNIIRYVSMAVAAALTVLWWQRFTSTLSEDQSDRRLVRSGLRLGTIWAGVFIIDAIAHAVRTAGQGLPVSMADVVFEGVFVSGVFMVAAVALVTLVAKQRPRKP